MSNLDANSIEAESRQWFYDRYSQEVVVKWQDWGPRERAEAILWLRKQGRSLRKIAAAPHCSEGLVRHYEIIARLPGQWKETLDHGRYSARQLVANVRAVRRAAANQRQREPDDEYND